MHLQAQDIDRHTPPLILPIEQPPMREFDSDVQPQRHPDEPPLPDESDNIPGDESDSSQT